MQTTTPTAKRALALVLMLAMLLSVLPTAALADTIGGEQVELSEGAPSDAGGLPPGTFDPEDPEDDMSENTGETPDPEGDTGGDNPGEPPADTPPVAPASAPPVTLNTPLSAEETIDIESPDDSSATGWSFDNGVVTITQGGSYRIEGTGITTNNRVVVEDNLTVTVTLNYVAIAGQGDPAFDIGDGATVNLWLEGSTALSTSSNTSATLHVPETATLVINSTVNGSLTASTSGRGAAIGGGGYGSGGTITIEGDAQVIATAKEYSTGAAIGGGGSGNGGTITIAGDAQVTATAESGNFGAAIGGGGSGGNGGTITIEGGTVKATTSGDGAAIGGGSGGNGGTITIRGDAQVTATAESGSGAAIGGGYRGNGGVVKIEGNTQVIATAESDSYGAAIGGGYRGNGGVVKIEGNAQVTATAKEYSSGAAIGGGGYQGNGGTITIAGGTVEATTSGFGAAIGGGSGGNGGNITIAGGTVEATTSGEGAAIGGGAEAGNDDCEITINGNAQVIATAESGSYGAAIGGGEDGNGGNITIEGGTVKATTSGEGAAIGGGANADNDDCVITIKGDAQVTATAEVRSDGSASSGAAIGGGESGNGGTVTIEGDAQVIATAKGKGAAIGGGEDGNGGTITIEGGTVEATTSGDGAAIGGGYRSGSYGGDGGNITIEGGTVIATTSGDGAAIGGGRNGNGGGVKIEGNAQVTATAESGSYGAAIGGGYRGNGGTITIKGGTVNATTSGDGAAIGGGYQGNGGGVTIAGGHTTATYIGRGNESTGFTGSVSITGGSLVIAETSGDRAPGGSMSATFTDSAGDSVYPLPLEVWCDSAPVDKLPLSVDGYRAHTDGEGKATIWLEPTAHTLQQGDTNLFPGSVGIAIGEVYDNPTFQWTLYDSLLVFTGGTLPDATVGTAYDYTFEATGGSGGYTYEVTTGVLPNGLTLADGVLSGSPTQTGNFPFTVQVKDSLGQTQTADFTLRVSDAPPETFAIFVNSGRATVGGQPISDAQQGVTVTITADAAPTGQVFDKWVVGSGNPTDLDVTANPATFTMPGEAVRITATYKADSSGNGGGTRPPSNSGGSTWTPSTVTFTGVPTGAIEVGKSFTVIPSYDDQTGSAGWTWDSDMFSATFNSPATFTALKEGTSTITYTTLDGVKSSFTVTVGAATASADPVAPAPEGTGSIDDDEKPNPSTGVHPSPGAVTSPIVKGGLRAAKRNIQL